ncbi:hypothetical protein LNTAR_01250 [Lentisphaera araneosa HTCC2155]|uniref:Uncharacterized protein n=1 Tax=Lentisphaera araneosa HTCC2155 TaxID=313628 RepID=A6DKT7_9BACT|nr:hypothetical protein [Lentisphaera araneosa]EDM27985.1 hypothetical protein LNTAR_01250 [Lentisphaera araneosa HTCC2155]
MLKQLAEASNDPAMLQRAQQTANYTTYYLQPDNRIVVGFDYKQFWYSCHMGVVLYLYYFCRTIIHILGGGVYLKAHGFD